MGRRAFIFQTVDPRKHCGNMYGVATVSKSRVHGLACWRQDRRNLAMHAQCVRMRIRIRKRVRMRVSGREAWGGEGGRGRTARPPHPARRRPQASRSRPTLARRRSRHRRCDCQPRRAAACRAPPARSLSLASPSRIFPPACPPPAACPSAATRELPRPSSPRLFSRYCLTIV